MKENPKLIAKYNPTGIKVFDVVLYNGNEVLVYNIGWNQRTFHGIILSKDGWYWCTNSIKMQDVTFVRHTNVL